MEKPSAEYMRPLYVVLFSTGDDDLGTDAPIVDATEATSHDGTEPHGLSFEVAAALPALWYALHLPASTLDVVNPPTVNRVRDVVEWRMPHRIILAPVAWFTADRWPTPAPDYLQTLVICPDDERERVARQSSRIGFLLGVAGYSELTRELLGHHWAHLTEWWQQNSSIELKILPGHIDLSTEPPSARLGMSAKRLARLLEAPVGDDFGDVIDILELRSLTNALAKAEDEGVRSEDEETLSEMRQRSRDNLRLAVTVTWPGVSPNYWRRVYAARKAMGIQRQRNDEQIERSSQAEASAIAFISEHHAIANMDPAIVLPSVPPSAFHTLADLERQWIQGPRPAVVSRFLKKLDKACADIWTSDVIAAVSRAGQLHVFSNFPLGLLRLPGDTAPLSCRVPIAYRPLMPLTRAVQAELDIDYAFDISGGFKLLVAECIDMADPVGRLSRDAWELATEMLRENPRIRAEVTDVRSADSLRASIDASNPDILVISAHGFSRPDKNAAGLVIGRDPVLGPELGQMPPFVILSACHSGPRGDGIVSISDMILRAGAMAVLSTLVPVDVRHNSVFITRLFIYISEVLAGNEKHATLLDVWHRVQTSNAINDILMGNRRLTGWSATADPPVVTDFMMNRSNGRIRNAHVYSDTEAVLREMAKEDGIEAVVDNWMRTPGYLQESAFYMMLGRPQRILFEGLPSARRE